MNAYTLSSDLAVVIDSCLSLGISQRESLRKRAAPLGAEIVKAFERDSKGAPEDASDLATAIFLRVRGEYLKAKTQGAKSKATALGEAWNRTRSAITAATDSAKIKVEWPALPSGLTKTGATIATVMTATQAKESADALADAKEQADAAALSAHVADEAQRELAELRALGPVDVALKIQAILEAWGGDQTAVFDAMGLMGKPIVSARDPESLKVAA